MKDIFKEAHIMGTGKVQFEFRKADKHSIKYIVPGIGYTRRKGVCFAILFSVWNRRVLFRIVFDFNRASKRFNFRKWLS